MLRLTKHHKSRVSNSLAILAALMLLVSATTRMNGPTEGDGENASSLAGNELIEDGPAVLRTSANESSAKKKGFKVSLYLFRLN